MDRYPGHSPHPDRHRERAVPDGRELRVTQVDADGTETLIQDWSAMEQEGEASSLSVSWTPNASGAHLRVETRDITRACARRA